MSGWQMVRELVRNALGVSPPAEPRVSDALVRALLAQQQRAVEANRRAVDDLADSLTPAERQQISHLLDDQRFLDQRP